MKFRQKIKQTSLIFSLVGIAFAACTKSQTNMSSNASSTLVIGSVDGKDVNVTDLSETEKSTLYRVQKQYYEATENLLSQYYFNQYLENFRQKNNLASLDDAKKRFFEQNAKVSKQEVDKFIKDNEASPQMKQIPADKRVELVTNYLTQMAQSKATQNITQNALKDGRVVVKNIEKPVAPKYNFQVAGYSLFENSNPTVTIVEFADYQCPYCVMAQTEIQKVLDYYNKGGKNKVQFVYYDFPLSFHDQAMPASVAAYCASKQGKFWGMHDKIFTRGPSDSITADTFTKAAKDLNLNSDEFKKCQEDSASSEVAKKQMAEGMRVGVQGTPALFINGVRYEKATSFDGLKAAIDPLL